MNPAIVPTVKSQPFRGPLDGVLIGPSILSADFSRLGSEVRSVLRDGADYIHVDVMDGHFVDNLSMGPAVCAAVRRSAPRAWVDVHLMVTDPCKFLEPFAHAGASNITFHAEAAGRPADLIKRIHELGMTAGIAIRPQTDWRRIEKSFGQADLFLVMSVNPGFGGQKFLRGALPKVRAIRRRVGPAKRVQLDGGVTAENAAECIAAGCDTLVAGSAIFRKPPYRQAIAAIRGARHR